MARRTEDLIWEEMLKNYPNLGYVMTNHTCNQNLHVLDADTQKGKSHFVRGKG